MIHRDLRFSVFVAKATVSLWFSLTEVLICQSLDIMACSISYITFWSVTFTFFRQKNPNFSIFFGINPCYFAKANAPTSSSPWSVRMPPPGTRHGVSAPHRRSMACPCGRTVPDLLDLDLAMMRARLPTVFACPATSCMATWCICLFLYFFGCQRGLKFEGWI